MERETRERESAWLTEEGVPWVEVDVHGMTTSNAFPNLIVGTDEFKEMRGKGKMVNFLKIMAVVRKQLHPN